MLSRRKLLSTSAAFAAAVALMPEHLRQALAAPAPQAGSLDDVEHVVLLMMENRSFDHYFGTLSGVRGFDDPEALILDTGRSVFHQPDPANPDGYLLPFHLDTATNSVQKIPTTSHAWDCQHESWNGGKMDNWMPAHRKADGEHVYPYVMGYYERADIPFHFALAEAFTVCDNYYCSVFGPTWPNRMMWMTGSIDPDGEHGGPILNNTAPEEGYTWTTYAERLERAGVSWKVYAEKDDFGCNMLKNFRSFRQAGPGSALYEKGIRPQRATQFEEDARAGRLPKVSWIIMTSATSEHPDYRPADGAAFIAGKLNAIAENPELWAKTVFILNYDENDGLFDHVPPPTPPPGTPGEFVGGLPIGGGFRVPAIVISPWTVGGWVSSEAFDHTSVLQFLEKFTGVEEPNISAWRRQTFGDLLSAFDFAAAPQAALRMPNAAKDVAAANRTDTLPKPVLPPARQSEPEQEPGARPRRGPAD